MGIRERIVKFKFSFLKFYSLSVDFFVTEFGISAQNLLLILWKISGECLSSFV